MESNSENLISIEGDDVDSLHDTSMATQTGQSECDGDKVKVDEQAQQRKKRKCTSGVWTHFRMLPAKPNEPLYCECLQCKKKYLADSKQGTGNLIRHMKSCVRLTTKDMGQYLVMSDKDACLAKRASSFSQEKFRELLVHAVIRHDLPFSFVEYEGVKNIFSYLEPKVAQISRNTAKADIKKLHAKESQRLRQELVTCPSKICLTSDAWSSIVTDGYLSLTAHYIDSNWVLQKKILNFSYFPPPHSGTALCEKIFGLVRDWGIEKKLFSITLDNASANNACVDLLKQKLLVNQALVCDGIFFHVRCCAHILNLIVQDGLKEIDVAVDKIRECVKYVKGSSGRKEKFSNCIQETSLDSKKALVQDVPTRWNSTYRMLSSALYYRRAFIQLSLSDSNFQSCPNSEEWSRVVQICGFLEVFHKATTAFSGSHYPTANLYFPQVFLIQLKLVEESESPDLYMQQIAKKMFAKFNKYWSEFNLLLAIALVFDPRYKWQFLEFSYRKLYGPSSMELAKVREILFRLFDEYAKASKPLPSPSTSRSGNDLRAQQVENEDNASSNFFKEFDEFEGFEFGNSAPKSQLELYLDEPRTNRTSSIHILEFWRSQQFRYPELTRLARDILCVPVSTVASESAFSIGGRILDQYRSTMSPSVVEAVICCRDWLFGAPGMVEMTSEEIVQDILSLNFNKDANDANESVALPEEASSN